jgi:hypothetical protein
MDEGVVRMTSEAVAKDGPGVPVAERPPVCAVYVAVMA